MLNQQQRYTNPAPGQDVPWYKQFWPWFIIALPASAVVAGFITLWLAISSPDYLVVDEEEYRRLNGSLKAQSPVQEAEKNETAKPESPSG